MNQLGSLRRAGVGLALGTDSPVTPLAAWDARAAVRHTRPAERLTVEEAFAAATLGGHRAAGVDDGGLLRSGWRADLACVEVGDAAGRLPGCRTGPRHTAACLYGNSDRRPPDLWEPGLGVSTA